ncbi:hypothetical protein VP01_5165g2, partial [Puccinia sorghi]
GTLAVLLISNKTKGRKFDPKGEEGHLAGFNVALRSYRIITLYGKVIESKHVRFLKKPDITEPFVQTLRQSQCLPITGSTTLIEKTQLAQQKKIMKLKINYLEENLLRLHLHFQLEYFKITLKSNPLLGVMMQSIGGKPSKSKSTR